MHRIAGRARPCSLLILCFFYLDHYIGDCPLGPSSSMAGSSSDPLSRPQHQLKRVAGIPKSFLEKIQDDSLLEGKPTDHLKKKMISYDGSLVFFTPNTREWDKFSSVAKATTSAATTSELDEDEAGNHAQTSGEQSEEPSRKQQKTAHTQ